MCPPQREGGPVEAFPERRKFNVKLPCNLPRITATIAFCAAILTAFCASPAMAADKHLFMVQGPLNGPAPFNVTMPTTTDDGKPVKTVVIDFVTADCEAPAGTTLVGSAQITTTFNGQNGFYHLAFTPAQQFPNSTDFVMTQQTVMPNDPGTIVNFGLTATGATCTVVYSGHLLVK
jgi:hypothetical protein